MSSTISKQTKDTESIIINGVIEHISRSHIVKRPFILPPCGLYSVHNHYVPLEAQKVAVAIVRDSIPTSGSQMYCTSQQFKLVCEKAFPK